MTKPHPARPRAVLFDRDDTLIVNVPYNGEPERVKAIPGARQALDRLRAAGIAVAVISNQSGIQRGFLSRQQVDLVNRRVEDLIGPVEVWAICPHGPQDGCGCRKPLPGLIFQAAQKLGVSAQQCVVIGDLFADMEAARAAGARGILIPRSATRLGEPSVHTETAPDLRSAIDMLLTEAS